MAASLESVEPGIFWRLHPKTGKRARYLTISYQANGKTRLESAKTTNVVEARTLRSRRLVGVADGTPLPDGTLTVNALLDRLVKNYERNARASLRTMKSHLPSLRDTLGAMKARDVRTSHIEVMQDAWQEAGCVTNATINKRCATLRRAFNLAVAAGDLVRCPAIPQLEHEAIIGKYLDASTRIALAETLHDTVATFLDFASDYGVRKGQLARVERTWVNQVLRVIQWPPRTVKKRRAHQIPLDARGWAIVERLLAEGAERSWCPYLFHGRYCHAGRKPSKLYGCIGDFKNAWKTACKKAGLPVGRKAGGPIFHDTRNTAVTDLLAGGMPQHEVMKVSNHETTSMIKHYDLGNIEALRARLEQSRATLAALIEPKTREHA
jgi:hypothetical protein